MMLVGLNAFFNVMLLPLHILTPKSEKVHNYEGFICITVALPLSKDNQPCIIKITVLRPSWENRISWANRHSEQGKEAILMYFLITPKSGAI